MINKVHNPSASSSIYSELLENYLSVVLRHASILRKSLSETTHMDLHLLISVKEAWTTKKVQPHQAKECDFNAPKLLEIEEFKWNGT